MKKFKSVTEEYQVEMGKDLGFECSLNEKGIAQNVPYWLASMTQLLYSAGYTKSK